MEKLRGYGITLDKFKTGEFYQEFEEETGAYHIFHTESDFSPYSFSSEEEAYQVVERLNKELKTQLK